jgi:hypothetical protein
MTITFLVYLIVGILLGRIFGSILFGLLDEFIMWYGSKYGRYTPGDGRNYMQIFKTDFKL